MGGDLVVALGRAAVDGGTLLGHNVSGPEAVPFELVYVPARAHVPGEMIRTQFLELPDARQAYAVVGARPRGTWGYVHGVNEHGVVAGCTRVRTRLSLDGPGLIGPDLVRLALERGRTALQARDALTALITRHGQGAFPGCPPDAVGDAAFLIADAREAFLVEASGRYWVYQEVRQVRAVSEVCTIRQDWDAIAPGLSGHVIEQGWWPEDGTKVDFAQAVGEQLTSAASAARRWGRATLALETQSGRIDVAFLRRLLAGHEEDDGGPLCRHPGQREPSGTRASLVAQLGASALPLAWWAYGPPCLSVYFPVPVTAELPAAFAGPPGTDTLAGRMTQLLAAAETSEPARERLRTALEGLQVLFDNEALAFARKAAQHGPEAAELRRLAAALMQHTWEEFAEVTRGLLEDMPQAASLALSS